MAGTNGLGITTISPRRTQAWSRTKKYPKPFTTPNQILWGNKRIRCCFIYSEVTEIFSTQIKGGNKRKRFGLSPIQNGRK
jgi:hypothetical protein